MEVSVHYSSSKIPYNGSALTSASCILHSFLIEIVQRRSESDCTVTMFSFTIFDVLTKPPNLISVLSRFHWRPVVVVLPATVPMGMSPQCGPSTEECIWILWCCVLGRSWIRQSSERRIIRMDGKRHMTLIFPISWSNLPPSAPATRIHNCNHTQIKLIPLKLH